MRRFYLCAFLVFACFTSFAQTANTKINFAELYSNYEDADYVVSVPVDGMGGPSIISRFEKWRLQLVYTSTVDILNGRDPRINIGFFPSEEEAQAFTEVINFVLPNASARKITKLEYDHALALFNEKNSSNTDSGVFPLNHKDALERLLLDAKQKYTENEYEKAQKYYQVLTYAYDDSIAVWATELLALTHDRRREKNEAINIYEYLLKTYPDSNASKRIQQRLIALRTAADDPNNPLSKGRGLETEKRFRASGYLSQFYRTFFRSVNDEPSEQLLEAYTTDFDGRAIYSRSGHNIQARLNGSFLYDTIRPEKNDTFIKRAFVGYTHEQSQGYFGLGRQKNHRTGVFTQFDGLLASYPVFGKVNFGVSLGQPRYRSDIYDDLGISFVSMHAALDLGTRHELNTYFIHQTVESVIDRQAVGATYQYANKTFSGVANIDFDTAFGELNNMLLTANYRFSSDTNFSSSFGYQRSPFLTATNILISDPSLDLATYLENQTNRDSLLEEANAITAKNTYFSLVATHKFDDNIQIISDYYSSRLSQQAALGATDEPAQEFTYDAVGFQVLLNELLRLNDTTVMGVKFAKGNRNSVRFYLSERIRFGKKLILQPRISFITTESVATGLAQKNLRYSLQTKYRLFKKSEIHFEAGSESISLEDNRNNSDSFYAFAGYRVRF